VNPNKLMPDFYAAMQQLGKAVENGPIDPILRELIKVRVSQINGCAFCLNMHTAEARALGETEQRLYTLSAWRDATYFSSKERAALALAEEITRLPNGAVSQAVYDEAAEEFEDEELAAVMAGAILMNTWNRLSISSGLEAR
jgi:AhpD family alkylhydroperoxidase